MRTTRRSPTHHVADELLTLLAAGHETTATTLAWTVERLRRHPRLLARLTAEVDTDGSELVQATIWEVQRTRPVINGTARITQDAYPIGGVGYSGSATPFLPAFRSRTPPRTGFPMRRRSIPTDSWATRRTITRGFPTAAECAAASVRRSRTWR